MKLKNILLSILILLLATFETGQVFAQNAPTSSNYKMLEYGFGGGGTASSSSNGYSLFGTLGQVDQGSASSSLYSVGAGLEYEIMASESAAPTFTNPSNSSNSLHLLINRGGADPTDYQYSIQVSTDNFATYSYVQNDDTLGASLINSAWQSYTGWGGSSGFNIIGLTRGTTYYARVASRQGQYFTQSGWSPSAYATTTNASFSFSLSTNSLAIGTLTPATVNTSSTVTATISTNASAGGTVYVYGANGGLLSSSTSYTISSSTTDLGGAGEGYGAKGTSVSQSAGGPMEIISPYNGASDNVGVVDTNKRIMFDSSGAAVTSGQGVFELKAKPSNTAKAASDYADTLTVVASGQF